MWSKRANLHRIPPAPALWGNDATFAHCPAKPHPQERWQKLGAGCSEKRKTVCHLYFKAWRKKPLPVFKNTIIVVITVAVAVVE